MSLLDAPRQPSYSLRIPSSPATQSLWQIQPHLVSEKKTFLRQGEQSLLRNRSARTHGTIIPLEKCMGALNPHPTHIVPLDAPVQHTFIRRRSKSPTVSPFVVTIRSLCLRSVSHG